MHSRVAVAICDENIAGFGVNRHVRWPLVSEGVGYFGDGTMTFGELFPDRQCE